MYYDINGNALAKTYDINGNVIWSGNTDPIALSDIVSYYQTPTTELTETLNALSDDTVNFIITTDTHGTANSLNSPNIIRYLLKNSKADKCFWLGDTPYDTWTTEQFYSYYDYFKDNCNDQLYFTTGNHDNYFYNTSTVRTDLPVIADEILGTKAWIHGNNDLFYYYLDDAAHKVRYIVLNTAEDNTKGTAIYISDTQIEWLKTAVQLPSADWSIIVLSHVGIAYSEDWNLSEAMATKVINALDTTNGTVIGYFCGHIHIDKISEVSGYHSVTLNCDARFVGTDMPSRTAGTVSEQAISIVSVNLTSKTVHIYRIGAGEDMEYSY